VNGTALDAYDRVVEVDDLDSLAAMAKQRGLMMLTFEREGVWHFVVDESGVAYVVKVADGELAPSPRLVSEA
jgi:hypothetical protein